MLQFSNRIHIPHPFSVLLSTQTLVRRVGRLAVVVLMSLLWTLCQQRLGVADLGWSASLLLGFQGHPHPPGCCPHPPSRCWTSAAVLELGPSQPPRCPRTTGPCRGWGPGGEWPQIIALEELKKTDFLLCAGLNAGDGTWVLNLLLSSEQRIIIIDIISLFPKLPMSS